MDILEFRILLYALVLLPIVTWAGRLLGYRVAKRLVACLMPFHSARPGKIGDQLAQASMMTQLVAVAAERSFSSVPCWIRALVLYRLLQRKRIRSEIRFGALRSAKSIDAHAWVEVNGHVFDPSGKLDEFYAARLSAPQ